jgi:hypothetical protein
MESSRREAGDMWPSTEIRGGERNKMRYRAAGGEDEANWQIFEGLIASIK